MKAISVKLPVTRNSSDGFTMIRSLRDMYRQNLKMLILTNPGERVMAPNFGVGLSGFLFEQYGDAVQVQIESKLISQVSIYMPNLIIDSVNFGESKDAGVLALEIRYTITNLGLQDFLALTI